MSKTKTKKKRKPLPARVREAASLALQGNDFWRVRAKHGRDVLFESPGLLREAAQEYLEWVETHPLYRSEWRGNGLKRIPVKRIATLIGFCLYCGTSDSWWRMFKTSKTFKENKGFLTVMDEVEKMFYQQKLEGAASGFFNANIIARDLGLVDRVDQTSADQPILQPLVQIVRENQTPKLQRDERDIE